ncbi:MAG: DNA repair protein RadC [Eubacteriales bacterium]
MTQSMHELPLSSRPYERLEESGEKSLSDAELIAILIKNGSAGSSSLELAQKILMMDSRGEGLSFLRDLSIEELRGCKGLGRVKAITLKAAMEMGRRSMRIDPFWKNMQIGGPKDAITIFENEMTHLKKEEVHTLLLDTRHRVIRHVTISSGGLASAGIYPRELLREAIKANAAAFVLAHNHPSGDPKPSPDDIATTKALQKAADLIGIELVDHIVVGHGSSVSLKELGCL